MILACNNLMSIDFFTEKCEFIGLEFVILFYLVHYGTSVKTVLAIGFDKK